MKKRVRRVSREANTKPKTAARTAAAPEGVKLIPQPHGGALLAGGVPGNRGNRDAMGPLPSALRGMLRGTYEKRFKLLDEIVDGETLEKAAVPFVSILPHVRCPKCGDALEAKDSASLFLLTIPGLVSPNVKLRLAALEHMAQYGMGPGKDLTVEVVAEKLKEQAEILRSELSGDVFDRIIQKLKAVWTS